MCKLVGCRGGSGLAALVCTTAIAARRPPRKQTGRVAGSRRRDRPPSSVRASAKRLRHRAACGLVCAQRVGAAPCGGRKSSAVFRMPTPATGGERYRALAEKPHARTRPANRARRMEGTFRTPSTNDGQRRNRPAHPRRIRRKHAWLARRLAPETVQRDRGLLRTAFIGLDRSAISACVSYTLGERPQSSANPCRIGATSPRGLRISGVRPIAASRRRWRIRNGNR